MVSSEDPQIARVASVQQRYNDWLMQIPHVIGVAVGYATAGGTMTDELSLVVMVDRKIPDDAVPPEMRIPKELDGVRVDVQETGMFTAGL